MEKFIEGKKILCEVDSPFYNLKIGYLYNIDKIDKNWRCNVTHNHSTRIFVSFDELKCEFSIGSAVENWFNYDESEIRDNKLNNLLQ
jgi:hypothetical protein